MKYTLSILLVIASFGDLDRIARINKLKKEAKQAYQAGDFSKAISKYHYLIDSMQVDDQRIRLNLANAYFQSSDTTNALNNYGSVIESDNLKTIKSTAFQQTGIIQHQQEKHKEALDSFKQAIKTDPTNEEARYNYEMLKKFLKEQEQNQNQNQDKDKQDQENKDQDKKDQEKQDEQDKDKKNEEENKDQEKQDKEGEEDKEKKDGEEKEQEEKEGEDKKQEEEEAKEGEEKDEQKKPEKMPDGADQKMKEMKISEEKAKMILEALKNQEVQYIQQNRKKAKERPKSNKPDW